MSLARVISEGEIAALEAAGKKLKGRREYLRFQSVFLRAKQGKTAQEIAQILGLHPRTVEKHHQRYFKEGLVIFENKKPGPRAPRFLTSEEEERLFHILKATAETGQILKAAQIKPVYEEKAGHPCSLSTIYVALKRNHWSKKQPRPRHPQGEE